MAEQSGRSVEKRVFALLREARVFDRSHRMALASWILFRDVTTFSDLSKLEYRTIADVLGEWQRLGVLAERAAAHVC